MLGFTAAVINRVLAQPAHRSLLTSDVIRTNQNFFFGGNTPYFRFRKTGTLSSLSVDGPIPQAIQLLSPLPTPTHTVICSVAEW